jgi:hypothetical protein
MSEIEEKVAQLEATEKEIQEKQAALEKTKAEVTDYEQRKAALDLELKRVQDDIIKAKEERRQIDVKDKSFQEKLRAENLEAAKAKFFSQFEYKPEEQAKFLEAFKSFDSQAVNVDLIYNDLLRTRVAMDPHKYIKLEEELKNLRAQAELFNKEGSSSGFPGGGQPGGSSIELTEDEIRAANWSHIPLERYKELKAKGRLD